jgi:hypothetical protein
VVVRFGGRRLPAPLAALTAVGIDDVADHRRLIVVGSDADLAAVLTRLLRADRLDIEVAHLKRRWGVRRAISGAAQRVPLIRDETGTVIVGAAEWAGSPLHGEAVVDDTVLFDGEVAGVRIEPTPTMPGLRAAVLSGGGRPGRWVAGRAAQLGTTGARVIRDGIAAPRPVRRSTFYRHTEGWLRVG